MTFEEWWRLHYPEFGLGSYSPLRAAKRAWSYQQKTIDEQERYIVQLETELKKCADEGVDYV